MFGIFQQRERKTAFSSVLQEYRSENVADVTVTLPSTIGL
jgi:hypothetical protein